MKKILSFLFFAVICQSIQAQTTFTEHLRKEKAGKGKVVIVQSPEIENVINNKVIKESAPTNHRTSDLSSETANSQNTTREEHEELLSKFRNSFSKDHQPEKMQGYRIQVYAGPKSSGQSAARKIEQKCKEALPGISTYVRFIQPRWTCRIGDFQTRADADLFLRKLVEAKVSPQITIVKCEIFKVY